QATLRLLHLEPDGERLRLRHEAKLNRDRAGGVEPCRAEGQIEPFSWWPQFGLALRREPRLLPEKRRPKGELLHGEVLDLDLERKFRQQRPIGPGLWRAGGAR